jgi:plastocyanin
VLLLAALLIVTGVSSALTPHALAAPATVNVAMKDYAFSPPTIVVVIGVNNTITWTNSDPAIHTVTATDHSFDSGNISPSNTYTRTFTTPGTFSYFCTIHTYMKGTIVVKGAAAPQGTTTSSSGGSSGGIPAFPFEAAAISALVLLVLASYLLVRRTLGPKPSMPRSY